MKKEIRVQKNQVKSKRKGYEKEERRERNRTVQGSTGQVRFGLVWIG